jgi:hypothetical protein
MTPADSPANYPIHFAKFNELFSSFGADGEILSSAKLFMFASRFRPNITKVRFKQVYDEIAEEKNIPNGPIDWSFDKGSVCFDALKKFSHEYYQTIVTSKEDYTMLNTAVPTDRVASAMIDVRDSRKKRNSRALDMRSFIETSVNQYCRQRLRLGLMTEDQAQVLLKSLDDPNIKNKISQLDSRGETTLPENELVRLVGSIAEPQRLWDEGSYKDSLRSVKEAGSRAVEAMLLHGPTDGGETFTRIAEQIALDNPEASAEEVSVRATKLTGFARAAESVSGGIKHEPQGGSVVPFVIPSLPGTTDKKTHIDPTHPSRLFQSTAKTPVQKTLAPFADAALSVVPQHVREIIISKSILVNPKEMRSFLPGIGQSPVLDAYSNYVQSMLLPTNSSNNTLSSKTMSFAFTNPLSRMLFGDSKENTASYLTLLDINNHLPNERKVLPQNAPLLAAFFPFLSTTNALGGTSFSSQGMFNSNASLFSFGSTPLPLYMTFLPEVRQFGTETLSSIQIAIRNFLDHLLGFNSPSSFLSTPPISTVSPITPSGVSGIPFFLSGSTMGSGSLFGKIPFIGSLLDGVFGGASGLISSGLNRFTGQGFLSSASNFMSSILKGFFGMAQKKKLNLALLLLRPDVIIVFIIGLAVLLPLMQEQYMSKTSSLALSYKEVGGGSLPETDTTDKTQKPPPPNNKKPPPVQKPPPEIFPTEVPPGGGGGGPIEQPPSGPTPTTDPTAKDCPTNNPKQGISGYCDYNHSSTPKCQDSNIGCWDVGAAKGAPINATFGGVVTWAGRGTLGYAGYGNLVAMKNSAGVITLFAHLASANVTVGQTVAPGQFIGYADATGHSEGDHLHYEVIGIHDYTLPAECYYNMATKCAKDFH